MIRPTRVRYRVVAMAVLLAMITYLDRVCIGKLAPKIMEEFEPVHGSNELGVRRVRLCLRIV